MEIEKREFFINPESKDALLKSVKKLAKRAAKLGLPEPTARHVEDVEVMVSREVWDLEWKIKKVPVLKSRFEITFPEVKIAGWEIVGTIDAEPVVTNAKPGWAGSLKPYRDHPTRCEHCNHNRSRKMTVVLQNETGELIQVGRSCLKDFTGHEVGIFNFGIACNSLEQNFGPRGEPLANTEYLLMLGLALIRRVGWTSRTMLRNSGDPHGMSTSDWAWDASQIRGGTEAEKFAEKLGLNIFEEIGTEREEAKKIIEFIADSKEENDYFLNLRSLCAESHTRGKHTGTVVSAAFVYHRHLAKLEAAKRAGKSTSSHFAKVGDKFGRKLSKKDKDAGATAYPASEGTISFMHTRDTDWGVTTLIKWVDDNGNEFGWWSSSESRLKIGQRISVIGTVKKLDEYKGTKSTMLSRCKVEKMEVSK